MSSVDILTYSDADFQRTFFYKKQSDLTAIDLTGSTLRMMVRDKSDSSNVGLEMSSANGLIVIAPDTTGQFTLTIPIAKLSTLRAGVYVHSMIRTRPDGIHEEVWRGALTQSAGPTR